MGLVSGAAKALGDIGDAVGLDWVVGGLTSIAPPIAINISVPEDYPGVAGPFPRYHTGTIQLNVPNNSAEFGSIAVNMAQNSLVMIELAVALQSIVDPEGGITIKDQLDPYHYQVIKDALEENGEEVPPVEKPEATTLNKLGGAITEFGLLSNLGTAADALGTVSEAFNFLKFVPQVSTIPTVVLPGIAPEGPGAASIGSSITGTVVGAFPDYALPLKIMNSATVVQGFIMQYVVSNIRNAIDTEAGALIIKNAMSDFTKEVSDNAIKNANQVPPEWSEPTGEPGIAG
jgi:hypothetical protein